MCSVQSAVQSAEPVRFIYGWVLCWHVMRAMVLQDTLRNRDACYWYHGLFANHRRRTCSCRCCSRATTRARTPSCACSRSCPATAPSGTGWSPSSSRCRARPAFQSIVFRVLGFRVRGAHHHAPVLGAAPPPAGPRLGPWLVAEQRQVPGPPCIPEYSIAFRVLGFRVRGAHHHAPVLGAAPPPPRLGPAGRRAAAGAGPALYSRI